MDRRQAIRNFLAAGAGSVFTRLLAGSSRDGADDDSGIFKLRSDVRLVLLDVSVKDSRGGFVAGLSKENFSVRENGRLQPITVFDSGDAPVTIGLLVDESRSMTPKKAEVLLAAEAFIQESNPQDEVFVLHFNDRVMAGLPKGVAFSDDIEELRAALRSGVPGGKTALYDAVVAGLERLESGKQDKKTLVLISDGGDNASAHKRRESLELVESSIATIYTIGLFADDDPDRDPGILQKLAQISGGEAYFPPDPTAMVPVCKRIAKEIRSRYTIGYLPPADQRASVDQGASVGQATGDQLVPEHRLGSLREVRVHVTAPGHSRLMVRTRSRYRYDALSAQEK
jgi:Ca-activated chloride channel homolog